MSFLQKHRDMYTSEREAYYQRRQKAIDSPSQCLSVNWYYGPGTINAHFFSIPYSSLYNLCIPLGQHYLAAPRWTPEVCRQPTVWIIRCCWCKSEMRTPTMPIGFVHNSNLVLTGIIDVINRLDSQGKQNGILLGLLSVLLHRRIFRHIRSLYQRLCYIIYAYALHMRNMCCISIIGHTLESINVISSYKYCQIYVAS